MIFNICYLLNNNYLYNQKLGAGNEITQAEALQDPEFIRFASVEMMKIANRLKKVSVLFNVGGKKRFTPLKNLKIVLHSDFSANAKAYLYSDTFHEEYVKFENSMYSKVMPLKAQLNKIRAIKDLEELENIKTAQRISEKVFDEMLEYIKPGEVTPFEYNSEKIKEIIISRRKQELLLNLQRDILNDALNNNKLKIIEENDKVTE